MKRAVGIFCFLFTSVLLISGCIANSLYQSEAADHTVVSVPIMTSNPEVKREDGAWKVTIPVEGSLQNPAWSPEKDSLLFTRFVDGYNREPADLFVLDLDSKDTRVLISDGSANVNLPGASWNVLTGEIVFSSSREPHDEIFVIDENGTPGEEEQITARVDMVAYEPSFSPDGQWIVFESHQLDVEDNGVITNYRVDGTAPYENLTDPDEDCRQPNWSPEGDKILFQKFSDGQWDIWIMSDDGTDPYKVTIGSGDKTDASFSPDGRWIVYSSNEGGLEFASLFIIATEGGSAIRITNFEGYDGAPSWSPDGKTIAFESSPGDPEDSSGTTIWMIEVPALSQ